MNEPVAWMMVNRENTSAYLTFEKPTRDMKISHEPHELYTHPVKEKQSNCEPNNKVDLKLTDEEIFKEMEFLPSSIAITNEDLIKFAKAILRKAQEK